jgi:hypothetical protein
VNPIHTGTKPPMPEVDCSYLCFNTDRVGVGRQPIQELPVRIWTALYVVLTEMCRDVYLVYPVKCHEIRDLLPDANICKVITFPAIGRFMIEPAR